MIWFSLGCHITLIKGDPGVMGVTSSGLRVAGFKMCKWPDSEPVITEDELGENWMFDVGKRDDVDGCGTVVTACLNFRVSHNLMVSSPPRVTTRRPSELMAIPLVQLSF
jgi:hypothetical protein